MVYAKAYKTNYKGTNLGYIFSDTMGKDENGNDGNISYAEWADIRKDLKRHYGDSVAFKLVPCK